MAVAKYDKNDDKYHCVSAARCDNCVHQTHKDQNNQWIIIQMVDKRYSLSYSSYNNISKWDWYTASGDCTDRINGYIADNGCGGGEITSRSNVHMKYAHDNPDLFKFHTGREAQIISWPAHDCTSP